MLVLFLYCCLNHFGQTLLGFGQPTSSKRLPKGLVNRNIFVAPW